MAAVTEQDKAYTRTQTIGGVSLEDISAEIRL